jgi:RNA polymerase sigma-70 factor (ECF subfamily)
MSSRLTELSARFLTNRFHLLAFIYSQVRDASVAEDIFQEVWLKLAEASERGVEIDDTARWCRGVAKNLILHYWREQRGAKVVADSELLELADQALSEHEAGRDDWPDRRQALVECLRSLPEKSKELLRLKYNQSMSAAAIAGQLQRSAAAILMALSRVRQALAHCVEKRLRLAEETG